MVNNTEKIPTTPITEKYSEMMGGIPDVLFVLSGAITHKGNRNYEYSSTSYADEDEHGILGGKARIIAAAELGKFFPEVTIVTTSRVEPDQPTHASVMAKELIAMDIPESQIVLEERSNSTRTEIIEMVKLAQANGWRKIVVLSSDYHLPRIQEMFSNLKNLSNDEDETFNEKLAWCRGNVEIHFMAAEDILPIRNGHYASLVHKAGMTEQYRKRVASEQEGIEQMRNGQYNHYSQDWDPSKRFKP